MRTHSLKTVSEPFILLLLIFPTVITIIEARSPHTWDTPFLFLGGNLTILSIYKMVGL